MASKKQHLETLSGVALFSGCNNKELEKVAKASDEIRMTAGTLIVDQGQTGREAFVVIDGDVDVKRNGRKVATLGLSMKKNVRLGRELKVLDIPESAIIDIEEIDKYSPGDRKSVE